MIRIIKNTDFNKIIFFALILIVIFIPFRELLGLYVNPLLKSIPDIIIGLLLILLIIKRSGKLRIDIIDVFFLGFLVFGFCSTVIINELSFIPYIIQVRSISLYYVLYFILKNTMTDEERIPKFLFVLKIMIYTTVGLAILEQIFSKEMFFPSVWKESIKYMDNFIRAYSVFNNPNTFGGFMMMSLMVLNRYIPNFWSAKSVPIVSVIMIGMIISGSRSTWLLLIVFISVTLIIHWFVRNGKIFNLRLFKKLIKKISINVLIVVIVVMGLKIVSEMYINNYSTNEKLKESKVVLSDRFKDLTDKKIIEYNLVDGRLYRIQKGIEVFLENSIVGTGFGTFGSSASLMITSPIYEKYDIPDGFYSDNEYIKVLVETGLIGFLLFITIIISLIIKNYHDKFLILFIFVFLGFGLFYNVFEVQILSFLFWITIGLERSNREKNLTSN